jgi:hypothetical protein
MRVVSFGLRAKMRSQSVALDNAQKGLLQKLANGTESGVVAERWLAERWGGVLCLNGFANLMA